MNGKPWTPQALTKLRVLYPYHPTWAFRVVQPELAIDVLQVHLESAFRHAQSVGDGFVAECLGNQARNIAFARRKALHYGCTSTIGSAGRFMRSRHVRSDT